MHVFKRSLWLVLDNGLERQKWKKRDQETTRIKERDGSGMGQYGGSGNGEKGPDLGIYQKWKLLMVYSRQNSKLAPKIPATDIHVMYNLLPLTVNRNSDYEGI